MTPQDLFESVKQQLKPNTFLENLIGLKKRPGFLSWTRGLLFSELLDTVVLKTSRKKMSQQGNSHTKSALE